MGAISTFIGANINAKKTHVCASRNHVRDQAPQTLTSRAGRALRRCAYDHLNRAAEFDGTSARPTRASAPGTVNRHCLPESLIFACNVTLPKVECGAGWGKVSVVDILSLAIGVLIGGLTASGLLGHQLKTRLRQRDAAFQRVLAGAKEELQAETRRYEKAQSALDKLSASEAEATQDAEALRAELAKSVDKLKSARNEHRKTKRLLAKSVKSVTEAEESLAALQKDAAKADDKLETERAKHKQARKLLDDARSENALVARQTATLKADLNKANSALKRTAPTDAERVKEIEALRVEIEQLETRLSGSDAVRTSAEEAHQRLEEQLRQAHADAYAAREEDSARLGEVQSRLHQQEAAVSRLRAELAWAQVTAEIASGTRNACDAKTGAGSDAPVWRDDPNQEKLVSMIHAAAIHKTTGGQEGQPLSIRNVMALSGTFGWNNKEAATRIMHAVSKLKPTVDEDTQRAIETEAEQFYFTYTS